jgi:ParB-like chromosome segregation protein Spo0J
MTQHSMLRGNGYAVSRDLHPRLIDVDRLRPLGRDTRKHPPAHVAKLKASIEQFGFVLPIVIDEEVRVVAGWGLVLAARKLGLPQVPTVTLSGLREAELRTLRLALNRLGEDSSWDVGELALEFSDILELEGDIDLQISGFEIAEIDALLEGTDAEEESEIPVLDENAEVVTRPADIWVLGPHRIICADARDPSSYERLLGEEKAQMVFVDPPHHAIDGTGSCRALPRNSELTIASGEVSPPEFENLLHVSLGHAARHSVDGAIHFVCTEWRHLHELLTTTQEIYAEMKDLCVWNKPKAGTGSLYRSSHELVFVLKVGTGSHINHIGLGKHGRNRSNVWNYAGQDALRGTGSKCSPYPTVKPVALVADAIRDCSDRQGIILDPFGGAGTSLIAAKRTDRRARLIEINPRLVDVTVRRWQRLTGGTAVHAATGMPFCALSQDRPDSPQQTSGQALT